MKDPRRPYDIDMLDGINACSRLARALLRHGGQLLDSAPMGRVGQAHTRYLVRIKLDPSKVAVFERDSGLTLTAPPVPQLPRAGN